MGSPPAKRPSTCRAKHSAAISTASSYVAAAVTTPRRSGNETPKSEPLSLCTIPTYRRMASPPMQLCGPPQDGVDAGLPARAGGTEVFNYIGVDAQFERLFWIVRRRTATANELVAVIKVGTRELLLSPFRRIVRINPCGRPRSADRVLVAFALGLRPAGLERAFSHAHCTSSSR